MFFTPDTHMDANITKPAKRVRNMHLQLLQVKELVIFNVVK